MDVNFVRSKFPGLRDDFIFMDNAGGSQVLGSVIGRTADYLKNYCVQLGATYEVSANASAKIDGSVKALTSFINAKDTKEIIVGPTTSMLLRILSICISRQWKPEDEVIVTNSDHEANVSCWTDLQEKGIIVRIWKLNPETLEFDLNDLMKLINSRTRLIAMCHVSNILGTINPVKEVAKMAHAAGALICVDGVAHTPHRLVDVTDLDVDFYTFSSYKVFGPHQAVMFGKYQLLREIDGINHYFFTKDDVPYKFQPGNVNFELTYSLGAIPEYFLEFNDHHFPNDQYISPGEKYRKSYNLIAEYEEKLSSRILEYLKTKKEIRIIGETTGHRLKRVPTISFVHQRFRSPEIVSRVDGFRIGIRYGDFYAKKIINDLSLVEKDGVVRVSLVHYNTIEELDRLIDAFETIGL
jgi:cysteine desulfurase family protein (TIGR01976 family)